jgi:hypothetical protein
MRLSEAILLGQRGCALSRAAEAIGKFREVYNRNFDGDWHDTHIYWPWINRSCRLCPVCHKLQEDFRWTIIHLWDYHVDLRGDWTIEKLADWVRSVEPADPAETAAEPASAPASTPQDVVVQSAQIEKEVLQ